jgi:5-enolpyruvylshikimate-3-phosphate synthase
MARLHLTGSKSECNRALIIEALSNGKVKVKTFLMRPMLFC